MKLDGDAEHQSGDTEKNKKQKKKLHQRPSVSLTASQTTPVFTFTEKTHYLMDSSLVFWGFFLPAAGFRKLNLHLSRLTEEKGGLINLHDAGEHSDCL